MLVNIFCRIFVTRHYQKMTLVLLVEVLFGFLFPIFFQGWCSTIQPISSGSLDYKVNVSCFIIDLKYIDCNWSKPLMQEINYTFSTTFRKNEYHECPEYLHVDGRCVGCRIPLNSRRLLFAPFYTTLSVNNDSFNSTSKLDYPNLVKQVILSPPSNITLNKSNDDEICLYWKSNVKPDCVVSMVRYRQDSGEWKEHKTPRTGIYCISLVNDKFLYTLQVRSKMGAMCGESDYWSNWSVPLQWGNKTEPPFKKWWNIAVVVLGVLLLITLSALLCYFERKRLPMLPAVLVPGKNLQDLFEKYNGNVETWVYMSKELKEAFEPDFTESPCVVTEPSPSMN